MTTATERQPNVPKLRFPEFDEEWQSGNFKSLGIQIIDGDRGENYPKSSDFLASGYCLFLSAKNVTKNGFSFAECSFISKEKDNAMNKGKLHREDIVLTTRGSLGQLALFDENVPFENIRINSGMVLLRSNRNIHSPFLYQQLRSNRFQREVERISFGSAQPQLTVGGITKMPLSVPKVPEQQRISAFLGAVDMKIADLAKKKMLLEDYKKGCMQKLFSRELRFKNKSTDGFSDWETTTLGKLVKISTGASNREDSSEYGNYTFFDRSADIRRSDRFLFDCEALIVAGEGKDFPPRYFKGKFDLHQRAYAITEFGKNSAVYLFHWINWHRHHFLKRSVGSTMPSLRMNSFTDFPVELPSLAEQQKIAGFLSAIDTKIQSVTTEIEQAQTFKKGLLQHMFV